MDGAEARILPWLTSLGVEPRALIPLRGDVSARKYFRLAGSDGVVAMYPPEQADQCKRFLATTQLFEGAGIRVPRVLEANCGLGLLLLEDLGDVSLFDVGARGWGRQEPLYLQAIRISAALAGGSKADFSLNPPLDAHRLADELAAAHDIFLGEPEFSGSTLERDALASSLDALCGALELEPLVPSHRDFMSRNLMLRADDPERLVVIDHQDACLAPRYYDLASLLNDSFFPTADQERTLLTGVCGTTEELCGYRRCAVQRAIKASATFIRFAQAGFPRHLPLVAPTLERAAIHLERLPEGASIPKSLFRRWRSPAAIDRGLRRTAAAPRVLD